MVRERSAGSFPKAVIVSRDGDMTTVIAGRQYAAGGLRQLFAGEHYRDLWAAPVRVPVLDLATFAGGLTPTRQGGGRQTASLRMQARDGRQFVFRTVAKDQRGVLPEILRATPLGDIFQDQASSMIPAGALVVDELAHTLGVYHPHPILVLAPEDERFGEFREAFAGRLGLIEEYPVAGGAGPVGIAGVDKIVSTQKLLKTLNRHREDRVDARSYLTARLLDLLIGDWDRHDEQWRWARRREHGHRVFYPLPRDRDQAFMKMDGLFGSIAEAAVVQMAGFTGDLEAVGNVMHSGRDLDSRVLADLDRAAWDDIAAAAVARLTDEAIDQAVRRLPQPYFERRGDWLAATLKARRDQLREASRRYCAVLSRSAQFPPRALPEKAEAQDGEEE